MRPAALVITCIMLWASYVILYISRNGNTCNESVNVNCETRCLCIQRHHPSSRGSRTCPPPVRFFSFFHARIPVRSCLCERQRRDLCGVFTDGPVLPCRNITRGIPSARFIGDFLTPIHVLLNAQFYASRECMLYVSQAFILLHGLYAPACTDYLPIRI
jgi:hypothetical protein